MTEIRSYASANGRTLIAYHYPCPDGIFSALAAYLHFKNSDRAVQFIPNTVYAPCSTHYLQLEDNDTLFLLDWVGPPGFAVAAARQAKRVVILDHHKTAMEALTEHSREGINNLDVNFDMTRSGATMALDYFNPQVTEAQQRLFKYIEDADLWRWAIPDSKAFHSGFGAMGLELDANKNPDIFEQLLLLDPDAVIAKGKEVQREVDATIGEAVSGAFVVDLGGGKGREQGWGQGLAVKAPPESGLGSLRSQLGNSLADAAGRRGLRKIGLVAYVEPGMTDPSLLKCSLRSLGSEDTTAISKAFGGGGHLNASSFLVSANEFGRWKAQPTS